MVDHATFVNAFGHTCNHSLGSVFLRAILKLHCELKAVWVLVQKTLLLKYDVLFLHFNWRIIIF